MSKRQKTDANENVIQETDKEDSEEENKGNENGVDRDYSDDEEAGNDQESTKSFVDINAPPINTEGFENGSSNW